MHTIRIHLIRHGQTEWNAEGRWQGALDVHLSAVGIEQAHRLARHLSAYAIRAIYSSDLSRAAVTARICADALGLPVRLDPRWREFNLGVLSGLTMDEIRARYPDELRGLQENYLDHVVAGGESRRMMMERAYGAWCDVVAAGDPEAAIFSHGGLIRVLLYRLFDGDPIVRSGHIENTSITTLEVVEGQVRLIALGQIPHLDDRDSRAKDGEAAKL